MQIFLCHRTQCVRVNSHLTSFLDVGSGIGQGTILGPLLFILFLNDMSTCLTPSATLKLFADDAKLYSVSESEINRLSLQENLNNIHQYMNQWQLRINPDKCECLHLGYNNSHEVYFLDDTQIPSVTKTRDLGVIISCDLKVRNHCNDIIRRAYHRLRQFHLAFSCKEQDFQLDIYKTYVRPILEYNTQVWSPYLLSDINDVERVQRFFTKRLPGMWNLPYLERLQILSLETLENRRIKNDLVLLYKIVYKFVDIESENMFPFNTNNTRGHWAKINHQYS